MPAGRQAGASLGSESQAVGCGSALGPLTELKVRRGVDASGSSPSPHQKQRPEVEQEPHWEV